MIKLNIQIPKVNEDGGFVGTIRLEPSPDEMVLDYRFQVVPDESGDWEVRIQQGAKTLYKGLVSPPADIPEDQEAYQLAFGLVMALINPAFTNLFANDPWNTARSLLFNPANR